MLPSVSFPASGVLVSGCPQSQGEGAAAGLGSPNHCVPWGPPVWPETLGKFPGWPLHLGKEVCPHLVTTLCFNPCWGQMLSN